MSNHRFVVLILVTILGFGMIAGGATSFARAQDAPIEPIGDGAGTPEIVVDGQRYLRDRDVPVDTSSLQETVDENGNPVYMKPGESDPLGAVYVLSTEAEGLATRYLPEQLGQPDITCPAENSPFGTLEGNGAIYAAAGPETDLTADMLTEIGAIDEGSVLYAEGNEQPFVEIFLAQNQGSGQLSRFVLMQEDGVPSLFSDQLVFAGTEFIPVPGAGVTLDGLMKIGCAGVFSAFAEMAEPPFASVVLQVGDQAVLYEAVPGDVVPAPEASPTQEATPPPVPTDVPATPEPTIAATPPPVPTDVPATPTAVVQPTEESTAVPTEESTAVPTEEPTAVPTEEPTAVPTEEPTAVPTEEPTAVPTQEPTALPTEEPTVAPTEEPTAVPTEEPTAVPTEEPTVAPTEEPTEEPAAEPAVVIPTEEALPTEVPPTPAPGTPESTLPPARPTPTPRVLQPAAVVPTVPAEAPSPAASSDQIAITCSGNVGDVDANGVPDRLPTNLQYAGSSYRYTGTVAADETDERDRLGCVGPFVLSADPADDTSLYLNVEGASDTLFRFEMTTTFTVESEVTEQPRRIQIAETEEQGAVSYRASEPMVRSTYSSVSLILYVADAEAAMPDRLLGYAVGAEVFGEYVPEGSAEQAPEDVLNDAEALGIHAELVLNGQRYVLTSLWRPFGTTTNGWLTLYGREGEAVPAELVGIDPRRLDLLVFTQID